MGNLNMLKERRNPSLSDKGFYARYHTRWRGLESHLLKMVLACIVTCITPVSLIDDFIQLSK